MIPRSTLLVGYLRLIFMVFDSCAVEICDVCARKSLSDPRRAVKQVQ
jgi:hypothetical protein